MNYPFQVDEEVCIPAGGRTLRLFRGIVLSADDSSVHVLWNEPSDFAGRTGILRFDGSILADANFLEPIRRKP